MLFFGVQTGQRRLTNGSDVNKEISGHHCTVDKIVKNGWSDDCSGLLWHKILNILLIMIEWLIKKQCQNYFMPGNNMLDHLPDSHDFEREVQFLIESVSLIDQYISNAVTLTKDVKHDRLKDLSVRVPSKLLFQPILKWVSIKLLIRLVPEGQCINLSML